MNCPDCAVPLTTVDLSDHALPTACRCDRCGGLWLARDALESVHAGVWNNVQAMGVQVADALSERSCPHCGVQCTEVSPRDHPEITVDRCPSCHGLWLDRGELDALYALVVAHAEAHGTLAERPAGWSALRWMTYRMAEHWGRNSRGID